VITVGESEDATERTRRRAASPKPTKAIAAVLFFAVAITALVLRVKSTSRPKEFYQTWTMICTNADCEKTFRQKHLTSDVFPQMTCPNCKQNTAFRAVQCRRCGTIFPLRSDLKKDPSIGLQCPNCRSPELNLDSSTVPLAEETKEK
jgi:ribosomal protein L40E